MSWRLIRAKESLGRSRRENRERKHRKLRGEDPLDIIARNNAELRVKLDELNEKMRGLEERYKLRSA